ncbi:Uncharacterised protein [Pseudomonas putida]|nr:Uncharacterised protein [Pseudomonas putida]
MGADHPLPAALWPRPGPGWRMGWRGLAGHRERARRQARLVRHVPAAGPVDRLFGRQRPVPDPGPGAQRRAVPRVGLAHSVPAQRRAGTGRPVCAPEAGRKPGVRQGRRPPRAGENAGGRPVFQILAADPAGRSGDGGVLRAVLHLHGVLAELWRDHAGLQPRDVPWPAVLRGGVHGPGHTTVGLAQRPLRAQTGADRRRPAGGGLGLYHGAAADFGVDRRRGAVPGHRTVPDGRDLCADGGTAA